MTFLKNIERDIRAFADDENDVIIERTGDILFSRFGKEIVCKLIRNDHGDFIRYGNNDIPYNSFISRELARLDIFAEKIITKYSDVENFINGPATLESISEKTKNGYALDLLSEACSSSLPFATKVVFITADAGHGKTILLKKYQYLQAKKFLSRESNHLFWHVDLQGRQLLRLNEALLGNLGDLRMTGLYMQSIVTLMRNGSLVLAIDGFDELAAEQGSSDALGALSHLVKNLENSGIIVAASRRTFFDAEEYSKRTKLLSASVSEESQYDQLCLEDWTKNENLAYLKKIKIDDKSIKDPIKIYEEIAIELKNNIHPMLSRPFLFAQIVRGLLVYEMSPTELLGKMKNPIQSVPSVVETFIEREVTQKWKARETGEPYLTQEQHMILLSHVADEMWLSQKEKLRFELIQEILSMLMDDWGVPHERRLQVSEMVKMHVLLIPDETSYEYRRFEHPEFKNFFLSISLKKLIEKIVQNASFEECSRFLSIAQLPDSVAMYSSMGLPKLSAFTIGALKQFEKMVTREWRPTYLQTNIGTIIPYFIKDVNFTETVIFNAKVIYSSIIFENTTINNFTFRQGNFINTKFTGINWKNVTFENCEFSEAVFDENGLVENVVFKNCKFDSIIICQNGEDFNREYSPKRIVNSLAKIGFQFFEYETEPLDRFDESSEKKLLLRFFNIFRRTTTISDDIIRLKYHPRDYDFVFDSIIPVAEEHGILIERKWSGGGRSKSWMLKVRIEDLFKSQDKDNNSNIGQFWNYFRNNVQSEEE